MRYHDKSGFGVLGPYPSLQVCARYLLNEDAREPTAYHTAEKDAFICARIYFSLLRKK